MTTALRAGTSNDGYWQVNTTDVLKITAGRLDVTGITVVTNTITINTTTGSQTLAGAKNNVNRWGLQLGDGTTESGSNVGGNFVINRHSDTGVFLGSAMYIERSNGNSTWNGNISPGTTNTYDLGNAAGRWRNVYTNDLHLSNGIGDYTVVEGEEDLYLYNNKNGKTFKFALIEVDPSEAPAKAKVE